VGEIRRRARGAELLASGSGRFASAEGLTTPSFAMTVATVPRVATPPNARTALLGGRRSRWAARAAKRAIDVTLAGIALVLLVPLLVVACAAICAESRGGFLYRQSRVGLGGRRFTILKLRTMRVDNDESAHADYVASLIDGDAEAQDGVYKLMDDPRRTTVGRLLRATSIDELPQLVNVLRGDMSLVGPRPSTPDEAALWDDRSSGRIDVKPGMTGLWQVSGRSRLTFDQMIDLDLEYARQWNPFTDLRIILRTPFAVFRRETA
jgi:lipopolysaccharide/colanic/teichoic acid biosynthesis glycosyltransferase